ncbi:hypothetical protein RKE29_10125 [Streptomyces sp. B1866]|uniref:hypothetical protein n=1 Tax=Streptomyces sp. B1866 TaxID=3075431 RepID=UPI002890ED29|nr:hypothetical protein [Streptomyces sp. B1866]MDT3396999.1 hypothetical protein [Streptomyces sp. B1866]
MALPAAVLLFTVPLVLGQERGWPLWCWAALGLAAAVAELFAAYEARLARRGGAPLISPRVLRQPGMPRAVARIGLAMAVNGGFLFMATLHLQSGLGYGPLRAGTSFVPTAAAFGLVGLNWQRLPARWHPVTVPVGFLLAAASLAGMGWALRGGAGAGAGFFAATAGIGAGLALAYSPLLTRTLASVRREDAADASGVLVTTTQLGLLIGVAAFGALFLGQAHGASPARTESADAVWVTCLALAATAVAAVAAGLARRRR